VALLLRSAEIQPLSRDLVRCVPHGTAPPRAPRSRAPPPAPAPNSCPTPPPPTAQAHLPPSAPLARALRAVVRTAKLEGVRAPALTNARVHGPPSATRGGRLVGKSAPHTGAL